MTRNELIALHGQHRFAHERTYYREPLVIERGRGCRLVDHEGREYLDFFAGIATISVGHAHPQVVEAVAAQVAKLSHVSTLYITEPQVRLYQALARVAPEGLDRAVCVNSGTEAIEAAITAARMRTGQAEIIALRHGYSGHSAAVRSLTGQSTWRPTPAYGPVSHAVSPYCYRCAFRATPAHCDLACAAEVEQVIRTTTTGRIAAVVAEAIQGVGGVIVPPAGYFERVAEVARRYGGLLIVDEIQTGFGRTGRMFAIEHWDCIPDMIAVAKGLGNGTPVGAVLAGSAVAAAFKTLYFSTFGANPVSMQAALAVLKVIAEEGLVENARLMGERLLAGLAALAERFPVVAEARGKGLLAAIELADANKRPLAELARGVHEAAKAEGLLIGLSGMDGNILRMSPPLTVTAAEVDEALAKLGRALAAAAA